MRKPIWTSFSLFLFLTLLGQTGCAPAPDNGGVPPVDQIVLETTLTPTTVAPATSTPTAVSSDTPTPVLATTTPTVEQLAVMLAQQLAPQFTQVFGVQFNPLLAKGLDAAKLQVPEGPPTGQLAEMIAPVVDANQSYTDRNQQVREVEGILSINDSRLDFDAMTPLGKGAVQLDPIPLGAYMIACHRERPNDCLAVSLQREEFQINPESISIIPIPDPPTVTPAPTETATPTKTPAPTGTAAPTGTPCLTGTPCPTGTPVPFPTPTVSTAFTQIAVATQTVVPTPVAPSVDFEVGSIRTCFWVFRRKVCIRVF